MYGLTVKIFSVDKFFIKVKLSLTDLIMLLCITSAIKMFDSTINLMEKCNKGIFIIAQHQ